MSSETAGLPRFLRLRCLLLPFLYAAIWNGLRISPNGERSALALHWARDALRLPVGAQRLGAVLTAGPSLDGRLALALWRAVVLVDGQTGEHTLVSADGRGAVRLPAFSSDLEAAHRVISKMKEQGWTVLIDHGPATGGRYRVVFGRDDRRNYLYTEATPLPLAICLAALAALEGGNVGA